MVLRQLRLKIASFSIKLVGRKQKHFGSRNKENVYRKLSRVPVIKRIPAVVSSATSFDADVVEKLSNALTKLQTIDHTFSSRFLFRRRPQQPQFSNPTLTRLSHNFPTPMSLNSANIGLSLQQKLEDLSPKKSPHPAAEEVQNDASVDDLSSLAKYSNKMDSKRDEEVIEFGHSQNGKCCC